MVLHWLGDLGVIEWSRASPDGISVRAKRGGEHTRPDPTHRGTAGSRYRLLVNRRGVPLAVRIFAAKVDDYAHLHRALRQRATDCSLESSGPRPGS